jgi:hypothetical protein
MIICHDSLRLETLKKKHIELVRQWRNSSSIKKTMLFQENISQKNQLDWFEKTSIENQLFFLCYENNEPIGVVYANKIDWDLKICNNSGIFIVKNELYGSGIPLKIAILFTQCGFALGLTENRILIRNDNKNGIRFNEALGYTCTEIFSDYGTYVLDKNRFDDTLKNIPKYLKAISPISIIWENNQTDIFLKEIFNTNISSSSNFFEIKD